MKRYLPGLITLLVLSEALGFVTGNIFFRLYNQTVPPAMLTNFNKGTAHAAFLSYGLGLGFVMFLWGLLTLAGSRFFRTRTP